MNGNENAFESKPEESFDFDELERKLEADLEEQLSDFTLLEEDRAKISNPDSLGNTVMNVVWAQFINQVGVVAGEDFIAENRELKLDLRDKAHIQTTENFANGKIATHNDKIDYAQRYDAWQNNFQKDKNGNIKTTYDNRTGTEKATLRVKNTKKDPEGQNYNLNYNARKDFDKGRPSGSASASVAMDHIVSAAEIIRDPAANAHLAREEQLSFANSGKNLNAMDSAANVSKDDSTMTEWLDSERTGKGAGKGAGKSQAEYFGVDEEELRKRDKAAREEYEKQKKEGEERSVKAGKQSQKEEAFRIGGEAIKAVVLGLLIELLRTVFSKFIAWIQSGEKNLETFVFQLKDAINDFVGNLKQNVLTAGNTLGTTIATAILGPVVDTIKKAWMFLKQGAKSLKEAINYIKDPSNKNKPFGILMLEVGKIVMAGLTAAGAIVLGEVIEKGLMAIPMFAIEIPLFGSLASILGMFLGALVSGLIGALALNLIDRVVAKKQKENSTLKLIDKGNEILSTQALVISAADCKLQKTKQDVQASVNDRHRAAAAIIREAADNIMNVEKENNHDSLMQIDQLLTSLQEE